jgi:hypothetical protein
MLAKSFLGCRRKESYHQYVCVWGLDFEIMQFVSCCNEVWMPLLQFEPWVEDYASFHYAIALFCKLDKVDG